MLTISNDDQVFLDSRTVLEMDDASLELNIVHSLTESDDGSCGFGHLSQMFVHIDSVVEIPLIAIELLDV